MRNPKRVPARDADAVLPYEEHGGGASLVVLLHWLGGGAQTWRELARALAARGLRVVAVDLPGFGGAKDDPRWSVSDMAAAVIATIRHVREGRGPAPWILSGHSMGGKVAAVVARAAEDAAPELGDGGGPGLSELRGLALVSPSPPSPEPIEEDTRLELVATLGPGLHTEPDRLDAARRFVDANVGAAALSPASHDRAVRGVLRADGAAFGAWLTSGSREDWSARIGVLRLPALVVCGACETALGAVAQRAHTLPHLPPQTELVELASVGHLAPLEASPRLAELFAAFAGAVGLDVRTAMDESRPVSLLDSAQRETLRALVARILPETAFDLADAVDASLAGAGDGYRHASLPDRVEAWRAGLAALDARATRRHGLAFAALDVAQMDAILASALDAGAPNDLAEGGALSPAQLALWMVDVRVRVLRTHMADPRTLERIGYTGLEDGDFDFARVHFGKREGLER